MIRAHSPFRNFAAALIVLAIAVRVIIPAGWMPSTERGFALTICTGMDTQTVWMDGKGKLHQEDPSKGKSVEHSPCTFASDTAPAAPAAANSLPGLPHIVSTALAFSNKEVSVGRGLAAPPPPAIGPPSYI